MRSVLGRGRVTWAIIMLVVHWLLHDPFLSWANRIEPLIGGFPYLFVYLWIVYIIIWIIMLFAVYNVSKVDRTAEG